MQHQCTSVENFKNINSSIKTVVEEAEYHDNTPQKYIATLYWEDSKEKPETLVMSYEEVVEYAKKHSKAWDAENGCFTGLWKDRFDLMATTLVTRKLIRLAQPKIWQQDLKHSGNYLLKTQDDVLRKLADAGMMVDNAAPYTFFIPTTLFFDVGLGRERQLRAPYAVLAMAMAANSEASFTDVDVFGNPVEDTELGLVRVTVYDPFAQKLEDAIRNWQDSEIVKGNARIVNGRFYKVA